MATSAGPGGLSGFLMFAIELSVQFKPAHLTPIRNSACRHSQLMRISAILNSNCPKAHAPSRWGCLWEHKLPDSAPFKYGFNCHLN